MKKKIALLLSILFLANYVSANPSSQVVSPTSNILQMMMGLAVVVFMIFALVWLIKKVGYASYQVSNLMKIKSCLPISTKEKLLIVEVGDEQLIIGVAPGFVGHIKTLDKPISENDKNLTENSSSSVFADKLKAMLKGETIE
ncbi:MAG: flagellar biosynthetic protein FliO [Cellvibrionaceae bacterium]